jgi:hypothetical protein
MKSVAKKLVRIHPTIPKAVIINGYNCPAPPFALTISADDDKMTNAAQVDSAKDPNKSAPIPATSPTLSPTLSAMVAGFFGESSGNPSSTFPTISAPTSAALV